MIYERAQLKRTLGRVEVFALAFGTMVGWGAVALPIQWIDSGGILGIIIIIALSAVMCVFIGLIYSELISAFPLAGAELAFTYRSMGVSGAWFTGWILCFAYIGIASFEGIALSIALNHLFAIPEWGYLGNIGGSDIYFSWIMVGMIGTLTLTILNIIGIRKVAIFQILLILVMVFSGFLYIFGAFAFGDLGNSEPMVKDLLGIEKILVMIPSMFLGFDIVAKSAEELNMPLKSIPKVMTFSVCIAGLWYIVITAATYFMLAGSEVAGHVSLTADLAAKVFHSDAIMKMIIIGGICGIITTWNGFIVGASRILFAMSRARLLPGAFGIVHSKFNTPVFSIVFVGLFCCISLFLGPKAFSPFLNIVAFGVIVSYLMVILSFFIVRKNEPDLRRGYKIKNIKLTETISLSCILFFFFWYTPLNPVDLEWDTEWIIIIVWLVIGSVLFTVFKINEHKRQITPSQREILIFGDKYARELFE